MRLLRALLVLGRVSNLPTVWSNCLAGWLLGAGYQPGDAIDWCVFAQLVIGATGIYLGGMFLNDACDAWWDREHRPERPIPAGAIRERTVWTVGIGLMAGGMFFLCLQGGVTAFLALLLFNTVLLYNFTHKRLSWSPLLIAGCRLLLILLAACHAHTYTEGTAEFPVAFFQAEEAGLAAWSALVMFGYVAGLSFLAREESTPVRPPAWPVALLALPVVLAVVANPGPGRPAALILSAILGLWVLRSLRPAFWAEPPEVGRTVGGLLAGIVLVDLLSVAMVPWELGAVFIGLFLLALALQRWVPAT